MRSPIILILGKPRTGKDAIIRALHIRYKIRHVHFLNLVQEEVKSGTIIGHIIEDSLMAGGSLVPRVVALELLKQYICKEMYTSSGFILEGFPRNLQQARDFEEYVAPISLILYLHLPPYWAKQRIQLDLPGQGFPDIEGEALVWRNLKFDQRTEYLLRYYDDRILWLNGLRPSMRVYVEIMDAVDQLFEKVGIKSPSRLD